MKPAGSETTPPFTVPSARNTASPPGRMPPPCGRDPALSIPDSSGQQLLGGDAVHVVKVLVLAAHTPDEGVVPGAHAGVDGPAGPDHRLLVVHDNVPGLPALDIGLAQAGARVCFNCSNDACFDIFGELSLSNGYFHDKLSREKHEKRGEWNAV